MKQIKTFLLQHKLLFLFLRPLLVTSGKITCTGTEDRRKKYINNNTQEAVLLAGVPIGVVKTK